MASLLIFGIDVTGSPMPNTEAGSDLLPAERDSRVKSGG
jgi:hypothetical protein